MFYRPKDGVAADVIPYYENGTFYLFYLKDYRDFSRHGEGCPWHLLKTTDLVNYTDCGVVLERGSFQEQDLYVFTGSVFRKDDIYYIFYTGHNPHFPYKNQPQEEIMLATSHDLVHWTKSKEFRVSAPAWYEMHDFRDPFVFYDELHAKYRMLLAARKKDGASSRRGVTAVAESDDLINWEVAKEPFYAPDSYFTHECPDLFRMGDWYYLLFSEFTDKVVTRYRMSRSMEGPWITPQKDTFDGHCFYAAKSCANNEERRFLFGWNPIRNGETDDGDWQWGGTIVPHEIVQHEDGTLGVVCPKEILASYATSQTIAPPALIGKGVKEGKEWLLGDGNTTASLTYASLSACAKIEVTLVLERAGKEFGILLRSDEQAENAYKIKFEPLYGRMVMDRTPRISSYTHCTVETERPLSLCEGDELHVTVLVEDSVVEIYTRDIAMSSRMFDLKGCCFGFYAEHCVLRVKDLKLYGKGGKQ